MKKIFLILLGAAFAGCASTVKHDHSRGSVVALDSDNSAHICMNAKAVQVGDQLSVFKIVCKKSKSPKNPKVRDVSDTTSCEKNAVGVVQVTELLDDHFIKVKPDSSFTLSEGMVVEKN